MTPIDFEMATLYIDGKPFPLESVEATTKPERREVKKLLGPTKFGCTFSVPIDGDTGQFFDWIARKFRPTRKTKKASARWLKSIRKELVRVAGCAWRRGRRLNQENRELMRAAGVRIPRSLR